jgi:hypothetical protein
MMARDEMRFSNNMDVHIGWQLELQLLWHYHYRRSTNDQIDEESGIRHESLYFKRRSVCLVCIVLPSTRVMQKFILEVYI